MGHIGRDTWRVGFTLACSSVYLPSLYVKVLVEVIVMGSEARAHGSSATEA